MNAPAMHPHTVEGSGRSLEAGVAAFRLKLLAGMALIIVVLTLGGLYLVESSVRAETRHDLQNDFAAELTLLRTVRELRHAFLAERCRALVRKPRIHAALEDNALDLLYPSARDELGDAVPAGDVAAAMTIHPRFYRFLDSRGSVIPPLNATEVGLLTSDEAARLAFAAVPQEQQNGCLIRASGEPVELIATPIFSTETGEALAALVAGFPMATSERLPTGLRSGVWVDGKLHLPGVAEPVRAALEQVMQHRLAEEEEAISKGVLVRLDGAEQMLFAERLNDGSLFPPVYEIGLYPLARLLARQEELRWRAALAGLLLLGLGAGSSLYISARLASPVRELATVSAENRVLRERAEVALEIKRGELERSARFSADASHQLKTPVAVMRAGLDELIASRDVSPAIREELSLLVHQTFRLTSIIEDLLLLSRLDSGRLQLALETIDLRHLVETCVDDLHLLYDDSAPEVQIAMPERLEVLGDRRYAMLIVQNVVENAHKYGRPQAPMRIETSEAQGTITLLVANQGPAIPESSRESIFERFHRAAVGENIPGHGLGLNLARELARLHGGDLSLRRSDGEWTEFEICFRTAERSV